MDTLSVRHPSTILVVEPDIMLGERILHALTDSGHEPIWLPPGSNIDALDLIETIYLNGLYCAVEMSGSFEDWEIGTIFNFYRPDCPVVFATPSGSAPPCLRRNDVFLRKPFAMDRLTRVFALDDMTMPQGLLKSRHLLFHMGHQGRIRRRLCANGRHRI